ncbi:NSS family neurotransmitter:Na+ symporter [Lewinella aquimaris]|uniref:NSS family neurotransmitter:Na+ symporter n=1 Tax=Neolewinella aquimaris TaxID=1835722 RepID=A0A840E972_9BACT|nr:sodium-dependent transporter [Neolewinella aquimaris]MBB4079877.1 NSS family neurotransmitter:Na+ symporter [Neolewinella aquimaris]
MSVRFSRLGHVLASAGAAIGVANLIIFPYRVHYFGGSAYVLAFVAFTLLMGIPLMILENAMGKRRGTDATDAFEVSGASPRWKLVAWLGILTTILVASFYLVLAGWTLEYVWKYATDYATVAATPAGPAFGEAIGNIPRALLFTGIFTGLVALVCSRELYAGIERLSKFAMPLLGILLVFLIVSLPIMQPQAVDYGNLLKFDWRALLLPSANGELGILHALGQAFFSLGLGAVAMLTFAAHADRDTDVLRSAPQIVHLDTIVAVLGALLVVPLLGGVQGDIYGGPPLVFINLVEIFKTYGDAAQWVGLLFFLLLAVAILTSAVSLFEPFLRTMTEHYGWERSWGSFVTGVLVFALTVPVVISCSPNGPEWLTDFANMGDPGLGYFNFLLEWAGSISLLVGELLLCWFLLKKWGLPALFDELAIGGPIVAPARRRRLTFAYRYVIPVGIGLLLAAKAWTLLF